MCECRCPLPERNRQYSAVWWARSAKATRNCCVGSWMEFPSSLVTPASLSAQVQRYCLSSRAVAAAPIQARLSDSSSFLLICVHGHLFSEACSCLCNTNRKPNGGSSVMGPATSPKITVLEPQLILVGSTEN